MSAKKSFHESFGREDVSDLPSERKFGLVMAGACVAFALLGWWWSVAFDQVEIILVVVGGAFLALALVKPALLKPLNCVWMKLGALLHTITNPVIMLLIYALTIAPFGLAMRLLGKDPLRRKMDREATTYWITRNNPGPPPEAMRQQF